MSRWPAYLVLAALLLGACSAAEDSAAAVSDGPSPSARPTAPTAAGATLRWALREPAAIVPSAATDDASLLVVDALFDALTAVDADGAVQARAAIRWRSFAGGRRWRFTLRPGARYHDGSPVRARDFVDSWSLTVRQGRTGSDLRDVVGYRAVRSGTVRRLAGVRALDDATLEIRLRRPDMDLPAALAHSTLAPLPPPALRDGIQFAANPIGNGPYRMAEPWAGADFIRITRAEAWSNGPRDDSPEGVGEIVFRLIDPDAAYVAFQQGRIDVAPVPAGALQQALRTYGTAIAGQGPGVVHGPVPSLYFLGVAVDRPPWDDPELRRALSRAIDRGALVDAQDDLELDPARGIVPPVFAEVDEVFCDTCLHLPSLAESAFEEAGITEVTFSFDAAGGHDRVASRIRADLAAVGVEVQPEELPFTTYLSALEDRSLRLYRFGWQAQRPAAGAMLEAIVGSGAPRERGDGANYGGYASSRVDDLLARARRTRSLERRQSLWARAEEEALRDQAIIPLFSYRQRTVIGARVEELTLTPWGTATPERARIVADPDIVSGDG